MQEINLLQNRVKDTTFVWQKQGKLILVILALILFLIVAGSVALFFLNQSLEKKTADVLADNQSIQRQLSEQQKNLGDAKAFQAQLVNLKVLLENHSYLSPLLDELAKITYQKAQYVTLDVAESGKIHVEGTINSYTELGKLLLGLSTSDKFKDVKLLSISPSSGTTSAAYVFALDMSAIPDIFYKQ